MPDAYSCVCCSYVLPAGSIVLVVSLAHHVSAHTVVECWLGIPVCIGCLAAACTFTSRMRFRSAAQLHSAFADAGASCIACCLSCGAPRKGITLFAAVDLQDRLKEPLVGLETRRPPQP